MDAFQIALVSIGINAVLALLGFLAVRTIREQDEKMAAQVIQMEEIRRKLHSVEVELPKVYATKQELLQSRQETKEVLDEVRDDIKKVLVKLGVISRAA